MGHRNHTCHPTCHSTESHRSQPPDRASLVGYSREGREGGREGEGGGRGEGEGGGGRRREEGGGGRGEGGRGEGGEGGDGGRGEGVRHRGRRERRDHEAFQSASYSVTLLMCFLYAPSTKYSVSD